MSPERAGSPLGMEPRELARTLQSAIPPFKLVHAQLSALQTTTISEKPFNRMDGEQQDDDLTSLTWLQDNNLLKGMNLTCAKNDESAPHSVSQVIVQSVPTTVIQSIPQPIPPLVMHRAPRPGTPTQQVIEVLPTTPPQQATYSADQSPTSDYMDESSVSEPTDSSSSSLNSPVPYSYNTPNTSPSKSSKHPHNIKYDPMIHTFSKPPYSFSSLIFMAIEDSPAKALPVKDIYAWILDHFPYFKNAPTGWKNSVRHNLSLNKCFQKVEKSPNLGKGSLWMVDQQYRPNLLQALTRSPFHPSSTLDPATFRSASTRTSSPYVQMIDKQTSTRLPNPELFPFLSRRLAASEAVKQEIKLEAHSDDDSLDDVHAATAILALKHGSRIIIPEHHRQKLPSESEQITIMPSEMVQVITRSPSEDHTYSSSTNTVKQMSPRPPSPDEAFESDDSMHSRLNFPSVDLEEQRRIEEGADALLNLAGISTSRTSNNNNHITETDYMSSPPTKRKYLYIQSDEIKQEKMDDNGEEGDDEEQIEQQVVREQKFRPRMLRLKRKHHDGNSHQSKRKFVNNNNIVDSKLAAKLISTRKNSGDWSSKNWGQVEQEELLNRLRYEK